MFLLKSNMSVIGFIGCLQRVIRSLNVI